MNDPTLRDLAPTDELTDDHLDTLLQRTWEQIADRPAARVPRRRSRMAVGGAFALVLAGGGVAVAATAHQHVADSFAADFRGPGFADTPDPATLQVPLSIPGPNGTDFQVFTEASKEGGLCVTTLFEPHGVADPPVNDVDPVEGGGGGGCSISHTDTSLFQSGTGDLCSPTTIASLDFAWSAPGVTRAELRLSTGRVLPVAVQNGWLGGWYTKAQVPHGVTATIVAKAADGRVLGTRVAQSRDDCR